MPRESGECRTIVLFELDIFEPGRGFKCELVTYPGRGWLFPSIQTLWARDLSNWCFIFDVDFGEYIIGLRGFDKRLAVNDQD